MKEVRKSQRIHRIVYNNLEVEQRIEVFNALDKLSEICQPARIIEIGTRFGGFTSILEDHPISSNSDIFTFDIVNRHPTFKRAKFSLKDCFKYEKKIGDMIKGDGVTLLFCDGGNKIKEFNTFAKYLKKGDMIFAHDYIVDSETFEKEFNGKIWNWHETSLQPISDTIEKENLKDILPEYFSKAVWKSCIKI
jgi:hypothetical protein